MKITRIRLKGFRNFKNSLINVTEKTLIIGANDVGKSNMLHAMRILLDRSMSDWDIEPKDSDFYCHEETNELAIYIRFEEVTEDCVLSKLPGKVSDDGVLYLGFKAWKDTHDYKFYAGSSFELLEEIQERFYRKVLHLKYISSNRDLAGYIKREKKGLLKEAQDKRTPAQEKADDKSISTIEKKLSEVNDKIVSLAYVNKATEAINTELKELSFHHEGQEVIFDIGASDVNSFIENLHLSSKVNTSNLAIGGDGRNNQIFLALWAAKNGINEDNPLEVVFYCIEEPEAHLHPHQQRKLAEYLIKTLKGQVFITSHSPQIASEFSPNSIVRLKHTGKSTNAASKGCSKIIEDSIYEFGYRLNVIAAEAFFANVVFLVEGPSEILFYKVLARELDIDLDRLNISVLVADGIGFDVFVKVLNALAIDWVVRTDNDVFKIPKKSEYRMAGLQRAISVYDKNVGTDGDIDRMIKEKSHLLTGFPLKTPPKSTLEAVKELITELEIYNIFLSETDLEQDMLGQGLKTSIFKHLGVDTNADALEQMQKRKASFMFEYLRKNATVLKKLKKSALAAPLLACQKIITGSSK
ncbi:putative ATP-dependent endonuclease of the OLD family [Mucilaginibacter gossypiicola]|uniref:Putative ATP-dependent endonuclease of the OLD family n=1 Tax=Mucilaginibacter gossypiicola TaxID=551995 RepID=A0A1H8LWU3_9SPHI|nr:AAA family ATPase [Mucilaginibacter gossypiicola]SEO09583.1 putative ATP-dependent endonuclease of the OLD family [Mucilaginibacter gossypiicola]